MARKKSTQVREQVVVYLEAGDRALLEDLATRTGMPRTELFRRGLRRLAADLAEGTAPGSSLGYLAKSATDDAFPPDVAERHDEYLYGGGYEAPSKPKRARPR